MEIAAFGAVPIETMLTHIRTSENLIADISKEQSDMVESIAKIFEGIESLQVSEATNEAVGEIVSIIMNEADKPAGLKSRIQSYVNKNKGEDNKQKEPKTADDIKAEVEAQAPKDGEDKPADNTKTAEEKKLEQSTSEYTSRVKQLLSESINTWRMTMAMNSSLYGVRLHIIKTANAEFIQQLTRFAMSK